MNSTKLRRFHSLMRVGVALAVVLCVLTSVVTSFKADAAVGINRQINFQGKLVNPNGTNVTDGSYSIVFSIYSVASAGTAIWSETQTPTVTNGIFQVNLGSVTALPGSVDFNTDNIYLGIKVGADAEMTPRIQFTAVPQAFNSEKLGGLDKTGFIQNGTTQQAASNFNISGAGVVGTSLTTPLLQSSAATALTITGNAASTWSTTAGDLTIQAGSGTVSLGTSTALGSNGNLSIQATGYVRIGDSGTPTVATADDELYVLGDLEIDGNADFAGTLAVNGDIINSDGNLSIQATGYVRIGDSGTPTVATADDELYVLGDLEVDANADIAGTLTVTSGATFSSTLNVAAAGGYYYGGTSSPLSLELTRTVPVVANDYVEIGNFSIGSGAHNFRVSITNSDSGFSVAKTYLLPIYYNDTGGAWEVAAPISETGAYAGNNYDLDVSVSNNIASLRLRRTAGSTAGTARIRVESVGQTNDVFTATTATGTTTAPAVYFGSTVISQSAGVATSLGTINISNGGNLQTAGTIRLTNAGVLQNVTNANAGTFFTGGTLSVARGGTGASTLTANGVLYGNGTGALQATAASTAANQCLVSATAGAAPTWGSCASGGGITGSGTLNYVARFTGAGTLGTGVLYDNGTNVGIGTSGTPAALLSVGGTTGNFQVSTTGAVTAVGINAGTGAFTGTGGATISGAAVNLNNTGTATTNIGNTTGALTLAGSSISLNSGTLSRTAAGTTTFSLVDAANTTFALTNSGAGVANFTVDGTATVGTLGATDNANYLCRNSSNQLAGCATTGTGAAFVQGGNSFGAQAVLGTNDAQSLAFETGGTTRLTIDTSGNANLTGNLTASNYVLANPGLGVTSAVTFLKGSDTAAIRVTEVSTDATEFGFVMGDNPDQSTDKFFWQFDDWQGDGGDWRPLEFSGLNANIRAANINAYGDYNIYGPWYSSTNGQPNTVFENKTGTLSITPGVSGFTGSNSLYWIKIDGTGSPNTFKWGTGSHASESNLTASAVPITGAAQTLSNGVTVTFSGTTGGAIGDVYQFRVVKGGSLRVSDGSAAAPSLSFTGDVNTGLYRSANDQLSVTTNGTERLRIDSTGNVNIISGALQTASTTRLTSAGILQNVTYNGSSIADAYIDNNLTVDWTGLQNYPTGCSAGSAVTAVGDTLTCAAFAPASGSSSYVQLQGATPGTAQTGNINITGTIIAGSFSGDGANLTNLNATNLSSGTVASARISGSYTGITGTGALNAGSITNGFGTINNEDTITGTTLNGTTGINTGSGAGTQRIDASGNLVNIGNITSTGNASIGGTISVAGRNVAAAANGGSVAEVSGNYSDTPQNNTSPYTQNVGSILDWGSSNAIDGDIAASTPSSTWIDANGEGGITFIKVNFNDTYIIDRVRLAARYDVSITDGQPQTFQLDFSDGSVQTFTFPSSYTGMQEYKIEPVASSFIRYTTRTKYSTGNNGLREIEAYASSIAANGTLANQNNIFYNTAKGSGVSTDLGIGTATPGQRLDVQGGNINTSGSLMTGGTARISSTGVLSNVTADASILTAGTLNSARLLGSYTGITGVGTLTAGTWNASVIADAYINDTLTIGSASSVAWGALNAYPTGCAAGQAITALNDTPTCSTFATSDTNTTYSAGNDLDLTGTTFDIESQLDMVSVINRASANLTLQTTTSGNIVLNAAGITQINDEVELNVMTGYQDEGSIKIGRQDGTGRYHLIKAFNDGAAASNYLSFNVHNGTVDATSEVLRLSGDAVATFSGSLVINGSQLTNNGSTLNTAQSLGDFATGGIIGTAAATVDVDTTFAVAQTTAGQTLSLPSPTSTTAGRIVYVLNTGSAGFAMHGVSIPAGYGQIYMWNGTSWILGASGGGSAITLQSAYDGGNTVNSADARNIAFTLNNTTTDANFLVNLATGSTGKFAVQNNGTDVLSVTNSAVNISGADLLFGTGGQVDFFDETGDKLYLYQNTYGIGIESSTLTNWSGSQFRWRTGGTGVAGGTERMLLTTTQLQLNNGVDLAVNGGDITSSGALNVTGGTSLTLASTGAGNDVIINSADTINLQDNTNVTGDLSVSSNLKLAANSNFDTNTAPNPHKQDSLRFMTTFTGTGNEYTYWLINNSAYTVASGDYLEYDVFCETGNVTCTGAIELEGTGVGASTEVWQLRGYANADQNGVSQSGSHSTYSNGQWYHRKVSLSAVVGKEIDEFSLVEENDTDGARTYYYRQIMITNGGVPSRVVYDGGTPQSNASNYAAGSSSTSVVGGYQQDIYVDGGLDIQGGNLQISGTTVITSGRVLQNVTADASILTAGTLNSARLSGSYTGITGVGTLTAGTWNGSVITDAYVADTLTVDSASSVAWSALNAYPAACSAGQAITALNDIPTCASFLTSETADVDSLNSLTGALSIVGNAQISVSAASPNINLSIAADSIGDTQLAFNTGQHLTTTSNVTHNQLTLGVATGTAPLVVTSTTKVANLNVDQLDGIDSSQLAQSKVFASTDFNSETGYSGLSSINGATNTPFGAAWYTLENNRHRGGISDGNVWGSQIATGMTAYTNRMAMRVNTGTAGVWTAWNEIWTAGSDGSGSGMDADLLDGQNSAAFAPASGSGSYIQNQTGSPQTAGFNINGNGSLGGTLVVTGAITGSSTIQGTRLISTVATGTAPLTVSSTTVVSNLNADLLDGISSTSLFNNMGQNHGTQTDFNSITDFGARYVQGTTNGPGTGSTQFYGLSLGLGAEYAYSSYALQLAIPRDTGSDKYLSIRNREGGTWQAWSKISAGYADVAPAGTLTGTTLASNVITSSITSVGVLGSGSISSGFGAIDIGADAITSGAITSSSTVQGTRLIATVATGTAPLTVSSTTVVANLNADLLDGSDASAFVPDMVTNDDFTLRVDSGFYQSSSATTAEGFPLSSNSWYHVLSNTHSNTGNYYAMQFAGDYYNSNDVFYRSTNGSGTTAWNRLWHQGNDGAGSGLDADTLDGLSSASFQSAGNYFAQGGNSFGATAVLGTNDAQSLAFETGGVTQLTVDTGGSANLVGNLSVGGRTLKLSNFNADYRWKWGGGTDLNWKKIADVNIAGSNIYAGASFEVDIMDAGTNLGGTADAIPLRYYVSALRSSGTQDVPDSGTVAGPVADYVRLVKTALGVYELQVRQIVNYRHLEVTARLTSDNGSLTLTYANTPVDGSTTGTIYTASTTGYTQRFPNVNVAGSFTGTGGATISGAAVNLNNNSNFAVNINTGSSTGTVAIGGTAAQTIGIGNGATGVKAVTVGSTVATSSLTLQSGAGISINASGAANTTVAVTNSGAGVANLTVDGSITAATGVTISNFASAGVVTNAAGGALSSSASLSAALGGTGQTSYAVGDLLYASGATALSKLAAVAAGSCLLSNGVGVAPIWGSCGASNTLQGVYGNDVDGSDAIMALTAADGSVIFRNPASGGSASAYVLTVDQLATGAVGGLLVSNAGTGASFRVNDSSGDSTPFIIDQSGNVAINFGTPDSSSNITLGAIDGANEGGQILLKGAASNNDMILDNFMGGFRLFTGGNVLLNMTGTGIMTLASTAVNTSTTNPQFILNNAATSTQTVMEWRVAGTARARIRADLNGNVVLNGTGTGGVYLSYDTGTGGILFGNGAGGVTASITSGGNYNWGGSTLTNDSHGGSIELGSAGTPFIDFSNDSASDLDVRIILTGDDSLAVQSGNLVMDSNRQVSFGAAVGDKLHLYENTYGIGIESGNMTFWSNDSFRFRIGGTSASGGTQHVTIGNTGALTATNTGTFYLSGASADLCYYNVLGVADYMSRCTSLASLKHDVQDLNLGLDTIRQLTPRRYNWNNDGRADLGFIAEEVQAVDPLLAEYDDNGNLTSVKYRHMIALAIEGIQELDTIVQSNTAAISNIQAQLNSGTFSNISNITVTGTANVDNLTVITAATIAKLTVTGDTTVANLYVGGKLISRGSVPAVALGNALTGVLGAAVTNSGTDTAGSVSIVSGTETAQTGVLAEVTFTSAYATAPKIVISGNNAKSAKLGAYVVRTATGFQIVTDDVVEQGVTYDFDYIIIEAVGVAP